jgi:hypothetical protein
VSIRTRFIEGVRRAAEGTFGVQAEYRFNSEEGRHLIEGAAQPLGLRQRRGTAEKLGLIFGAVAIGGIVLGGVVMLILLLADGGR